MPTRKHDTLEFRADFVRRLRCAVGQLRANAGMIEVVLYQLIGGPMRPVGRKRFT